jgi:hypothetical protein
MRTQTILFQCNKHTGVVDFAFANRSFASLSFALAEEAYQAAKKNVDKHAQLRDKYFKEADAAYEAGDKDKARELREKAKAETQKMEEAQDKAAREVFDKVYDGSCASSDYDVWMSHLISVCRQKQGQGYGGHRPARPAGEGRLEAARGAPGDDLRQACRYPISILAPERAPLAHHIVVVMMGTDIKELSVITGAGNHSGKEGPKIKPAVEKYFKEQNLTYRHEKNGELVLTL